MKKKFPFQKSRHFKHNSPDRLFDHYYFKNKGHHSFENGRHIKRRNVAKRFGGLFFFMMILMIVAVVGTFLLSGWLSGTGRQVAITVWIMLCSLPLIGPLLIGLVGMRHFWRDVASPLADIMAAADAVAEGDLTVQIVDRHIPGDFGQLTRSFNRMVSELQRAEQQRRNLTADVAHELRTPLHIIQGNLEGILDGVYEPTQEHIQNTLEETHLLTRLVEDLQLLSKAESGELQLHRRILVVSDLLADIETRFSPQTEAAGIALENISRISDPDCTVMADPDRIYQVLNNLVVNAIRHTPTGGKISLEARKVDEDVEIIISDTGEGIKPEDIPFVFERFWRSEQSRTRSKGGSGLGLAIAQKLMLAHGGTIRVESKLGEGTTFFLRFSQHSP